MNIDTVITLRLIGYFAFLVIPIILFFTKGISKRFRLVFSKYLLSVFLMGLTIIAPLIHMDYQLTVKYEALDRNGDGSISAAEELTWSDEDKKVNELFFVDGARNVFGYVVIPLFGFIYTAIVFLVLYTSNWLFGKLKLRRKSA